VGVQALPVGSGLSRVLGSWWSVVVSGQVVMTVVQRACQ